MAIIDFPILYIPDPTRGRPLFNGQIFVGVEDLDPEIPANQKQLNVVQEDGTIVPVAQPFILSSGGVPVYNGSPVRLDVDGNYSIKILDRLGAQVYYIENVLEGQPVLIEDFPEIDPVWNFGDLSEALNETETYKIYDGAALNIAGRNNENDGGGAMWDVVLSSSVTPDGYGIIQSNAIPSLSFVQRTDRIMSFNSEADLIAAAPMALNTQLTIINSGGNSESYIAAVSGDIDLGGGLFAKKTFTVDESVEYKTQSFNTPMNSYRAYNIFGNRFTSRVAGILGDSISQGANAENIPDDSWVGIFRKMFNQQFGANNYGFVTAEEPLVNSQGTYNEIHTIALSSGWTSLLNQPNVMNGFIQQSSTVGALLSSTLPTNYGSCSIWFDDQTAGEFRFRVNGGAWVNIVTGGGTTDDFTATFGLTDDGTGSVLIEVEVVSGTVGICGFSYFNGGNTQTSLYNWSKGGRQGQTVSEQIIEDACQNCYFLVWALGVNERNGAGGAAYSQRIDWLIQYANQYNTRVVILDLLFTDPITNNVRADLKRAYENINNSVYVPVPEMLSADNQIQTDAELNTNNFSSEPTVTHPTYIGHRMIAEAVSRALGLANNSKKKAEYGDSTWKALQLINGVTNLNSSAEFVSAYRIREGYIDFKIFAATPANNTVIAQLPVTSTVGGGSGKLTFLGSSIETAYDGSGNSGIIQIQQNGDIKYLDRPAVTAPTQLAFEYTMPVGDAEWFEKWY